MNNLALDVRFGFSNNEYIVEPWHWFTFPLSALIYTLLQFRLARKALKEKINPKNINWVYLFSGICTILFAGMLMVNIFILKNLNNAWSILHQSAMVLILCTCLLLLSLSFFINPELIFGFSKTITPNQINLITEDHVQPAERFNIEKTRSKTIDKKLGQHVEDFLSEKQVFRQNGLTLSELASLINTPSYKLSDLFNNHFQLNFNTYINNLRINYIKQRLDSGDWKQYSLETIALDVGFTSRNTFFVAFKKATGTSPSAYLSSLKKA